MSSNNTQKVGIVGVGFVGEALVQAFSAAFPVVGIDLSQARLEHLKNNTGLVSNAKNAVVLSNDSSLLKDCDLVCISVPTPITDAGNYSKNIDMKFVKAACETVRNTCRRGTTVVMESSVCVGSTRSLLGDLADKFFIGFSPERIDPGRTFPKYEETPKIVSAISEEALEKVKFFYERAFTDVVPVSTLETAEMCKLYENCYRMINIAYVNEIADACVPFGIDPMEMINASATKPYGFQAFFPNVGCGGTCIPINPHYLFTNCDLPLLKFATTSTAQRPDKYAEQIVKSTPAIEKALIVGLGYKTGQGELTESPYLQFALHMASVGVSVDFYDPFVAGERSGKLNKVANAEDLKNAKYDVIMNFHKNTDWAKSLDLESLGSKVVVDQWFAQA